MHPTENAVLQHLPIVNQEVSRRLALGVPSCIDRSDLVSQANEALVVAVSRGTRAIRLAVRNALVNLVKHEAMRARHSGDVPAQWTTKPIKPSVVAELIYDLTPRQMMAVRLVYYEGFTQAEAAERMNCTQPDVNCLLAAAKNNLRAALIKYTP